MDMAMGMAMDTDTVPGRRKMGSSLEIIDIHTHVLPGIDDGAQTWDMSMQMLRMSWDSGVRRVIATPHYLPWERLVHPDRIREMCIEAGQRFSEKFGLQMTVCPGEELYYYSDLLSDLQTGKAMTMNDTSCVLVEFGVMVQFKDLLHAVQRLQRAGYRVILAHYERYDALRQKGRIEELLECDVLLQSNLDAADGGYFDSEARRIRKDYKKGNICFSASDMHNVTTRLPIGSRGIKRLAGFLKEEEIRQVLFENAARILM